MSAELACRMSHAASPTLLRPLDSVAIGELAEFFGREQGGILSSCVVGNESKSFRGFELTDHRSEFQRLMRSQYERYKVACAKNEFRDLGYVLFLDRAFADKRSRLAFLGINPGQETHAESYVPLTGHSIWNSRDPDVRHSDYWGLTRVMLQKLLRRRDDLADTVNEAFFGNVIPFRSPSWQGTSSAHQDLMRECALPITRYLFDENLYDTVIAVGEYPQTVLAYQNEPMIRDRTEVCIRFPESAEAWPKGCRDQIVHRASGPSVRILKIPHLSRKGYAAAEKIGNWLADRFPCGDRNCSGHAA